MYPVIYPIWVHGQESFSGSYSQHGCMSVAILKQAARPCMPQKTKLRGWTLRQVHTLSHRSFQKSTAEASPGHSTGSTRASRVCVSPCWRRAGITWPASLCRRVTERGWTRALWRLQRSTVAVGPPFKVDR